MKVENDEEEEEEEYQDDSNNSASDKDYVEEEKEEEVTDKGRGEKKISAGKEGSGERAAGRAGRSKSTNDFKRKERTVFQHGNPYFVAKAGPEDWKSLRVPTNVLKDFGLELAQKIILPSEQG